MLFLKGIQVMKLEEHRKCYLLPISTKYENIQETKTALKKVKGFAINFINSKFIKKINKNKKFSYNKY